MTGRDRPPFRAEHVGSLLRPPELAEARARWRRGELAADALAALEDEAVREAVAMQEAVGLRCVTDGELRRDYWHLDFLCGLDGVELSDETYGMFFSGGHTVVTTYVGGPIRYPAGGIMREHFAFLAGVVSETPKLCIPAPGMLHMRPGRAGIDTAVYPDLDGFWDDLTTAYRAAVADYARLGCTYLQLDNVAYAYLCDDDQRARVRARGDDPDQLLLDYVRADNAAIAERPSGMIVTTHMCRGNFRSEWMAQGGYDPVAERLLNEAAVDGFFLEYDTERAGGFEPLRFVPDDKLVVLGLVTTKQPELESKDALRRRIDEAARYVPLDRLCLSPQCGFASTYHGNAVTPDDQRRKLALVVEVAHEVWGEV